MKMGRVILIIVIAIFVGAITYIIIKLVRPSDQNTDTGTGTGNTGSGSGSSGGSGSGSGGSGSGNNTPLEPIAVDWTTFKVGERVFAVKPTTAWDRDTLGYNGYLGRILKTFQPGAYIGTVSSIIPIHGLMVKNNALGNPNFGDPFFILGLNEFRKG